MTVVFDPAAAIAAGLCVTARTIAQGVTTRHPRPCGWCDWPVDELRRMIDGFNEWAGYRERTRTYERHDARVFAEMPRDEQRRLVLEAQAFPADPPTAPTAPPPDTEPVRPSWMPAEDRR